MTVLQSSQKSKLLSANSALLTPTLSVGYITYIYFQNINGFINMFGATRVCRKRMGEQSKIGTRCYMGIIGK